jgi:hypothetical protein
MAKNQIAMGINLRQNNNSMNAGYGKFYPEIDLQSTLSLRGFAKHMADHGSIYSMDIIEGVLKKITQCLPELVSQGIPVQLDPLGTFYPSAKVDQPVLNVAAMEGADPNNAVKGIHIRFLPYSCEDENITSRRFKEDFCTLEYRFVVARRLIGTDPVTGKKKYVQDKTPIETFIADWKKTHGEDGGSSTGSDTTGGDNTQGGNQGGSTIPGEGD